MERSWTARSCLSSGIVPSPAPPLGALEEAGAQESDRESDPEHQSRLAPGQSLHVLPDGAEVAIAQVARSSLDLFGQRFGEIGHAALIFLSQVLAGAPERRRHPADLVGRLKPALRETRGGPVPGLAQRAPGLIDHLVLHFAELGATAAAGR